MVAVERCPVVPDTARLADSGFRITGHKLEVYGYCADCARKLDEADTGGDEKGPL
jgi:Fe2+ or Zn2+ uptake regulation protein